MTIITGWRNRAPEKSRAFSDDPVFNGTHLKNSKAASAANERFERVALDSINTEFMSAQNKRKRLAKASI